MSKIKEILRLSEMENTLPGWLRGGIDQCLVCLFLLISGICVYRILQKGQIEDRQKAGKAIGPYRFGMFAAPVAAIGMVIASVSAVIWGFMANSFAPSYLYSSNLGIFQLNTPPFYLFLVLIMLLSTSVSGVIAVRGVKYIAE